MALVKCKECGNEVSSEAETCPKCGSRVADKPMGCGALIGVVILVGIIISVFSNIFSPGTPTGVSTTQPSSQPRQEETKPLPDMIPSLATKPIDQRATAKAASVKPERFCKALGQALRSKHDPEYKRAMLMRAAADFGTILTFADQDRIVNKSIALGLDGCAVSAARGYPERVNRSVYSFGEHEQWVYGDSYLYFENGILTSWQD